MNKHYPGKDLGRQMGTRVPEGVSAGAAVARGIFSALGPADEDREPGHGGRKYRTDPPRMGFCEASEGLRQEEGWPGGAISVSPQAAQRLLSPLRRGHRVAAQLRLGCRRHSGQVLWKP